MNNTAQATHKYYTHFTPHTLHKYHTHTMHCTHAKLTWAVQVSEWWSWLLAAVAAATLEEEVEGPASSSLVNKHRALSVVISKGLQGLMGTTMCCRSKCRSKH